MWTSSAVEVINACLPAFCLWWISSREVERNWPALELAQRLELHDYMTSLLGKPGAGSSSYSITGGHFGDVDAPANLGIMAHILSGGSVIFPIYQTGTTTSYAFDFARA
jgi:hypothetical protein